MRTRKCDRFSSTMSRVKCFLRSIINQEKLNVLKMLSIVKELVQLLPDIDNKVRML